MNSIRYKIGLDFEFFNAIEADNISDSIQKRYFSKTDFHLWNINQTAVMATFMSHISLLRYSMGTKTNLLILEDDIDIVGSYNWDDINFSEFDLYNIGSDLSCYSYFVSYEGAKKILNYFDTIDITQAYDWELKKINHLNVKLIETPLFIQTNTFVSNIAPNGYYLK
jgi:GR25 family glycosyltransferase involved in LPS biosynthesis